MYSRRACTVIAPLECFQWLRDTLDRQAVDVCELQHPETGLALIVARNKPQLKLQLFSAITDSSDNEELVVESERDESDEDEDGSSSVMAGLLREEPLRSTSKLGDRKMHIVAASNNDLTTARKRIEKRQQLDQASEVDFSLQQNKRRRVLESRQQVKEHTMPPREQEEDKEEEEVEEDELQGTDKEVEEEEEIDEEVEIDEEEEIDEEVEIDEEDFRDSKEGREEEVDIEKDVVDEEELEEAVREIAEDGGVDTVVPRYNRGDSESDRENAQVAQVSQLGEADYNRILLKYSTEAHGWFNTNYQIPSQRMVKIYEVAVAIASPQAIEELQSLIESYSTTRPSEVVVDNNLSSHSTLVSSTALEFCRLYGEVELADTSEQFRAVTHRVRLAQLSKLYNIVNPDEKGRGPVRSTTQNRRSRQKQYLFDILYPNLQHEDVRKHVGKKKLWGLFSSRLSYASRWARLAQALGGYGVLGLIPHGIVSNNWLQKTLPDSDFSILLEAVRRFNPNCIQVSRTWNQGLVNTFKVGDRPSSLSYSSQKFLSE